MADVLDQMIYNHEFTIFHALEIFTALSWYTRIDSFQKSLFVPPAVLPNTFNFLLILEIKKKT